MNTKAKREYEVLLKSGDLLDMFPDFTGEWKKDKKQFLNYWESNQEILGDMNVDFEQGEFL